MKTAKQGLFNIIFGVFGQIVALAFAFLTPKLVIENYGSEINGLLHSVTQIFTYFSLFEAGVGAASVQALYGPYARGDEKQISAVLAATRVFYNKAGLFYAVGVAVVAVLYPLAVHTSVSFFAVVAIIFFGGIGGSINFFFQGKYILLMKADGHNYISANVETISNFVASTIKILLLINGFNVLAVQISFFAVSVFKATLYMIYVRKHYHYIDLSVEPDFQAIAQRKAVFVHQVSALVFNSTDVLLLTFLTQDLKIVSVYSLYNSLLSAIWTLVNQVSSGFDFRLGQIYAVDRERYYKMYHTFEIFHLVVIYSVMSALYMVLLPFMRLYTIKVTDINYINNVYPLLFISIPLVTHGRTAANSTINYAGHFEKTKKYAIVESSINLAITVVGILFWGIPGALLGTIIASIYRTCNIVWYTYSYLIPGSPWKTIRRWLCCIGLFALVVVSNQVFDIVLTSYFQIFTAAISFGFLFLLIYGGGQYLVNKEERRDFSELLTILTNNIARRIKGR